jgi:putative ABC transport system permease protein
MPETPDWNRILRDRLADLKLDPAAEAEIFDELAQHLEDRYQELVASGVSEADAQRIAAEPLYESPSLAEALQRARRRPAAPTPPAHTSHLGVLIYDIRMALRAIRQKPGFAAMVIGILALGIGGCTAIGGAFNSLFLKPLPFPDSGRLIDIDETAPKWNLKYVGIAEPDFCAWRERNTTFDSMAFFQNPNYNLSKPGPAQHIRGAKVTRDMLNVLRLKLVMGRNFLPEEDRPKGEKVALLGYGLWQRVFSGDPNVLGRMVELDDEPYKIVGVLPKEAVFPDRAEVWTPLGPDPTRGLENGWGGSSIGRLKSGVTARQAYADLLRIHRSLIATGQTANEITSPILTPVREYYLGDFQTPSRIMLVAVIVVLLIACANIAALMLVRASARTQEIAIRAAIGASRSRIIRQLLTENAVLAAAGGMAGVFLGWVALRGIVSLLPDSMPRWIDFRIDGRFAASCVLLTVAAALLSGLIPALQGSRADLRGALHEAALRASASRGRRRTLNALVVAEVALALAVLIPSGLLLRAFEKVLHVDPGFRPDNVLAFSVGLPEQTYSKPEQAVPFYRNLLAQLRVLPGVIGAGASSAPPLGGHWGQFIQAEGEAAPPPGAKTPVILQVVVTPGYFDAIGMTVLAGRQFDEHDGSSTDHPVAMVDENFARLHWPGTSPIGKRIRYPRPGPWWTVVGLLRNEKHYGLDGEDRPTVYTPELQLPWPMSLDVVIRAQSNPELLTGPARRILERLDPDLPMYRVRTMTSEIDRSLWARRAYSWLIGIFAAVALVLAAAGIYGVISYAVSQRTREIGVRIALGASPREILAAVLRSGMALVTIGAAVGLALTLAAARLLSDLLFGVSPHDPLVYGAVLSAVTGIGLLANGIPARRAATVDPLRALRSE